MLRYIIPLHKMHANKYDMQYLGWGLWEMCVLAKSNCLQMGLLGLIVTHLYAVALHCPSQSTVAQSIWRAYMIHN